MKTNEPDPIKMMELGWKPNHNVFWLNNNELKLKEFWKTEHRKKCNKAVFSVTFTPCAGIGDTIVIKCIKCGNF